MTNERILPVRYMGMCFGGILRRVCKARSGNSDEVQACDGASRLL